MNSTEGDCHEASHRGPVSGSARGCDYSIGPVGPRQGRRGRFTPAPGSVVIDYKMREVIDAVAKARLEREQDEA